jgi:FlaA1/EpsC-like NDP-sugar epimerase
VTDRNTFAASRDPGNGGRVLEHRTSEERILGMTTLVVTGGAGAIGSRLVLRLLDEGAERVLVVDDSRYSAFLL